MIINFGKYFGKSIEQIGDSDEGLLYLDSIVDDPLESQFKEQLKIYLKKNAHRVDDAIRNCKPLSKNYAPSKPKPWWEK